MRRFLIPLVLACTSALAQAQTSAPAAWTLKDQFDAAYTLDPTTRVVLIARSHATANLVNSAVEHTQPGYLDARKVVFVADIARVPGLVLKFLVPNMRSANYRILLDRDGQVAERYAGDRETVQWLDMDQGKVVRERHFEDLASLRQALASLVPPQGDGQAAQTRP